MTFTNAPDLSGLNYDPQNFRALYETELGKELWKVLTRSDNVIRMETATYLEQAAVEPLGPELLALFSAWVNDERVKQMIGHMARQIMEHLGYEIDRPGLRIMREGLFTTAARYRRPAQIRDRTMVITREQRLAWQEKTANSPFNKWLDHQVKRRNGTLDLTKLYQVATSYGVTNRYDHLNPGQQRMNIGIKLRACVSKDVYEPHT
jgi:hypothetical protein